MPGLGANGEVGSANSLARNTCEASLNDLRSQEVTPHKLQLCWDTLRWFSKKFGMMAVHEEHRLLQTDCGRKLDPSGHSAVPIHPGADSPQGGGGPLPRELDSFILGLVRFQVGCSARLNDLQHTAPCGKPSAPGGKGKVQWLTDVKTKDGTWKQLCMRWQSGKCTLGAHCKFQHSCAYPVNGVACGLDHGALQHQNTSR